MTFMRACLSAVLFALLATSAHADAPDRTFTGYARSLETRELLYIESHAVRGTGANESRVVLYRCAGNAVPFARKQLEYSADRTAPAFEFDDARSGFAEGLRRDSRGLTVFERAGPSARMRTHAVTPTASLVVDAGFDEFVRANWDSLERGTAPRVAFLVPSLLDTANFRIRKVDEVTIEGELASVIRLSLAGPLGWFLPDIDVSYRKRDRRLMRYRGLTNMRDARGELLKAEIIFPEDERSETRVDLGALRAIPLAPCSSGG